MKKLFLVISATFIFVSCSKDQKKSISHLTKKTEVSDCEYIIDTVLSASIYDMLANPNDPNEETLDRYLYYIARALSKYSCISPSFQANYEDVSFSRYTDADGYEDLDTEAELQDFIEANDEFLTILNQELSVISTNWESVKGEFVWNDEVFTPIIYFENGAVADWSLAPYIGIGADVEDDLITEYIPAFSNKCKFPDLEPSELLIGKVDPQAVAVSDPGHYEANCLYNPLLIVQLGWPKNKKSENLGDPELFAGTIKDTVLPDPPGSTCVPASHFYLIKTNLAGKRYERSKYSEISLEKFTIPTGTGNLPYWPYYSSREHLRKVHKNDINQTLTLNHELKTINGVPQIPIGPVGSAPGHKFYGATYEYDWYAKNKNITFSTFRGVKPTLKLRYKGVFEFYQIMWLNPNPPEWCEKDVRVFPVFYGKSEIIAKN